MNSSTLTRTSMSHPLRIEGVQVAPGYGQIGITFCPGKKQPGAMTGSWDRDLAIDLDAISKWGAAALISLIEPHEMDALGVPELGTEVVGRHMDWIHLPIEDVSVPGPEFELAWRRHGEAIRARLRDGFDIVVHCKGGLGRAGTIAARLLVEFGSDPEEAIAAVRAARPGAIETPSQAQYVRTIKPAPEHQPSKSHTDIRDRALGSLVGLAVGDAVGTTLEFKARDSYPLLTDMIGGGPFGLKPGQWTDDTSMALALADSLINSDAFDAEDLMRRFIQWREEGAYSSNGRCFDIGITVSGALQRWKRTGDPIAGDTDPQTAGNGSLMRLAPVALRYWNHRETLRKVAAQQSLTTHGVRIPTIARMYSDLMPRSVPI